MSKDDETTVTGVSTADKIPVSRPELAAMIEAAMERVLITWAR